MKGKNLQPRIRYPARLSSALMEKSKVYKQVKAKRIQHHQTSFITNTAGISPSGKEKATTRNKKITKGESSPVKANI